MMTDHTVTVTQTEFRVTQALETARELAKRGAPIFRARPGRDGEFRLPLKWERTEPDPDVVDAWQPGEALAMVTGVLFDVVDCDPRNGGTLAGLPLPTSYGRVLTPSGGTHDYVYPLGVAKSKVRAGVDLQAGRPDGTGRGFVFLAPTVRASKVTGELRAYEWEREPEWSAVDLLDLLGDDSGRELVQLHESSGDSGGEFDPLGARSYTPSQALASISRWADEVRETGPGTFRDPFLRLCNFVGGFVPKVLDTDAAEELLYGVVRDVWGAEPDSRDVRLVESGIERGSAAPFIVMPEGSDGPGQEVEQYDLFAQTPILEQLRGFAYSRKAAPHMLLALVLGRVLAEIPAGTMLPGKTFGTDASLNLCVAAVGPPGSGKSKAFDLSEEFLFPEKQIGRANEENLGTSEGIAQEFLRWDKDKSRYVVKSDPRCIFTVDEVDAYAHKHKTTDVASTLRTMATGGQLGARNAGAETHRRVPKRSYRAVLFIGVQPAASEALLSDDEINRGTPQRFLWERSEDRSIPRQVVNAAPLDWEPPLVLPDLVDYPDSIYQEVDEWHYRSSRGEVDDPLEGHLILTKLKVAAAFAFLHDRTEISETDWEMAGYMIRRSSAAQQYCLRELSENASKSNARRAVAAGKAEVIKLDVIAADTALRDKVRERILELVEEAGEDGLAVRDLRSSVSSKQRPLLEDQMDYLESHGKITTEQIEPGKTGGRPGVRIRLT